MDDFLISLLVAGLGALASWAIAFAARRIREARLRERFPVAGRFLTEYEDRVDGEVVTKKAITTLAQRGRQVSGKTVEIEDGRSWNLTGTVERGGFLHGVYGADDPHDSGVGTFFVEIGATPGDMDGLWAGYDSMNGDIAGGRYTFRRTPDVTIRRARSDEAARVCALLGAALGEQYVQFEAVRMAIAGEPRQTCLVAIDDRDRPIAAATMSIISPEEIADFLPEGQEGVTKPLRMLRFNERIGLLRSVAVAQKQRGRGIATELVQHGLAWAAARDATGVISFGWKSDAGCHLAGVMVTAGFTEEDEIPGFWTKDSEVHDYACPSCGGTCRCSAVIFTRGLEDVAPLESAAA